MDSTANEGVAWPELHRVRRAIVVVDVVESVRLMQEHEADVIDRWRRFVNEVRTQVLPKHGGRLVKSLGDGMLLEFEEAPKAVAAALEMQDRLRPYNAGRDVAAAMFVRIGIHSADVLVDDLDIYGAGVNLAARLASIAGEGQIVASASVRDQLVADIDAIVVDLGDRWVKHIAMPVHVFRVEPVQGPMHIPTIGTRVAPDPLQPTVAVIPLTCHHAMDAMDTVVGELFADGVIAQLSPSPDLRVVSRLSTSVLRERPVSARRLAELVGATYVLSGSYVAAGPRVALTVELADARDEKVVWSERLTCAIADLLAQPSAPIDQVVQAVHHTVLETESKRTMTQPLPSLEGFSLLLGSIGLLHRASEQDFLRAQEALSALADRVPRHAAAYAWLAKWHCLRIIRGLTDLPARDRGEAEQRIEQALERDESSSLAWSLRGLVHGFIGKQLALAEDAYQHAILHNPNEPLAWLYMGTLRSWQGRGPEAARAAARALELSPLDPMRYYFESLAAAGMLADDQFERAIALCKHSIQLNRRHTPTYRVLAISQALSGRLDDARATISELRVLEPRLTASAFLDRYPGGPAAHACRYADALRDAGLPH
jgi:class 3 adenylate cyclase/TolB-like protein/tetratricopeptide (TPR) repeat protein